MDSPQSVQPEGQPPNSNKKWIIIGVVVLGVLFVLQYLFSSFLSPTKFLERSMESAIGGDVDIDINDNGIGEMRIKKDGMESNIQTGSNVSLPSDWPKDVPIIGGSKILSAVSSKEGGKKTVNVMYMSGVPAPDIVRYYKAELAKSGWNTEGEFSMGQTNSAQLMFKRAENASVMLTVGATEGGESSVSLTVIQE